MEHDLDDILLETRIAARIVVDPRGGPIRRIINGRHCKPTGRYSSVKARRALPWEDKREREYFWHCEADAGVVTYLAQPHRLELKVGLPDPLIYFPDVQRALADGITEIIEIKNVYDPRSDPIYDLKLRLAAEVYQRLGWRFRIVGAHEIECRQTLRTASAVQRYRHVKLSLHEMWKVTDLIQAEGGATSFSRVAEALGGGPAADAKVCASIVRRFTWIDITSRLSPETSVHLAPFVTIPPCRSLRGLECD